MTPRQIAYYLRHRNEWITEIRSAGRMPSPGASEHVSGGGGAFTGGPTAAEGERIVTLRMRVAMVDRWLYLLTELERRAALFWLAGERTAEGVARDLRISYGAATYLVRSIPLLIWGRLYPPPVGDVDDNEEI